MLKKLFIWATTWTIVGLGSGLYYRELSKHHGLPKGTQLAVTHTHALAMGALAMLTLLAVAAALRLERNKPFGLGVLIWNIGLIITVGMMVTKGTMQVLGKNVDTSAALAGPAGLGHIIVTIGFAFVLIGIGQAVSARQAELDAEPAAEPVVEADTTAN